MFGGLSILHGARWCLAVIPLAGIVLGWLALRRIRQAPDEWTGLRLARLGHRALGRLVGGRLRLADLRPRQRGSLRLPAGHLRDASARPAKADRADPAVGAGNAGQEGLHAGLHAARPAADGHQGVHPLPDQRRVPVLHPQSRNGRRRSASSSRATWRPPTPRIWWAWPAASASSPEIPGAPYGLEADYLH